MTIKYLTLHKHHIKPKHSGGQDDEENFTYLTVREHTICHFLLWKMYGNENDLRSMKMLGANLSINYRRKIGIFCRDNKIGFHKYSSEQKSEFGKIGGAIARDKKLGFHGLSEEEKIKNASAAGKIGGAISYKKKTGIHQYSPEEKRVFSSMGGKISGYMMKGYVHWVGPNGERTRSPECPGEGWVRGMGLTEEGADNLRKYIETKKIHLINLETGEKFYEDLDNHESIEKFLLQNPNIKINQIIARLKKYDVYISCPTEHCNKLFSAGWQYCAEGEQKHKAKETLLSKKYDIMYFDNLVSAAVPLEKKELFLSEGWAFRATTTKYTTIEKYGYSLKISVEHTDHFVNAGWKEIRYYEKKPVERNPGAKIIHSEYGYATSVHFSIMPKFLSEGWVLSSKNDHEIKRIKRQIAKFSSATEPLF